MKKIYLFLLICIGVFAFSNTNAQSTQGGNSPYAETVTSTSTTVVVLAEACDDFGLCFDEMYAEFRLGLIHIEKVGTGYYRVSYSGVGSVIVGISQF